MKTWQIVSLFGVVLVLVLGGIASYVLIPPTVEPEGERSAALYEPGSLGISESALDLIDQSRPTAANGEFEGADSRLLLGHLWMPGNIEAGPFPLIVYSHGFMSTAEEARYYAEFLVPKGYIVAAVNYPLTNGSAPGGPNVRDVRNQPGDVSFVIDRMLSRNEDKGDAVYGLIDPDRIAVAGLSLGGLTTILTGFHPEWRDPRVKAIASIAGPSAYFDETFFASTDAPFLMIAGTTDAIVPYGANAAHIPEVDGNATLVTLEDGSHVGFAALAAPMARWATHPDEFVCPMLVQSLDRGSDPGGPLFAADERLGIITPGPAATPCQAEAFEPAMGPYEQLMLTRIALYAFFESVLAKDPARRSEMREYLTDVYAAENPATLVEVSG